MRFILAATRALIGYMVSLHLLGLKLGIKVSDRKVKLAMRRRDLATTVRHYAEQALATARSNSRIATSNERSARTAHAALVSASVAEADALRRGHTVGA